MEESRNEYGERIESNNTHGRERQENEETAGRDERSSEWFLFWRRKPHWKAAGQTEDERVVFPIETLETSTDETKDAVKAPSVPPNGGYGWCIVVASFFVHMFVLGNIYSFGVLYAEYIDYFDEAKGVTAYAGSIGVALLGGLGAWSGQLADQHGNNKVIGVGAVLVGLGYLLASFSTSVWHLYLTQGLITGVGYSFAYIAGVSIVGQWFTTKRGLAVGIAVAGSGVGQFIMSMVTSALISHLGWRGALRVLAAINFTGLSLCALTMRRFLPLVTPKDTDSWLKFFSDPRFSLIYAAMFFTSLGMYMPYTYLPLYCERYGLSKPAYVLILSLVGISSAVGRVVLGYVSDSMGKMRMLKTCMLCAGGATLCWQVCRTFPTILVYGLAYGFFAGGTISLMPTVSAELFGIEKLGAVVGALFTASAVGSLLSAPIGGFLLDGTGGYHAPITVCAAFLLLGFVVLLPMAHQRPAAVDAVKGPPLVEERDETVEEEREEAGESKRAVFEVATAGRVLGGEGSCDLTGEGGPAPAESDVLLRLENGAGGTAAEAV